MLFQKLGMAHDMDWGFSVPKDILFPSTPNYFSLYRKTLRKLTKGNLLCLKTSPKEDSILGLAQWLIHFLVLGSLLRRTSMSEGEMVPCWRVWSVNLQSQSGLHFGTCEKLASPALSDVRWCGSFSSVLTLNQAVSQEDSAVCQFNEF